MDGNPIRRRLAAGERLYGCWISTASPAVAELLAHAGYDFLVIDQEHGPGTIPDAVHMLRACDAAGCPAIVRVPWNDQVYLKRILDAGARSVMVPMVETPEEAEAAAAACRYPPLGRRGYAAPAMRCSAYGFRAEYRARAHEELFLIAQIESAAAATRAQAIAAVDGIDMVLIGVNDLAGTIGRLEQLDHPEVRALVATAEAGLRAAGKPMGTVPSAARTAAQLFAEGYALVAGAGDVPLLREAARADLRAARGGGGSAGPY
jgi:4-hydroxy-2-oxoheptanedioate aldolase